jgi:hypothetical protein
MTAPVKYVGQPTGPMQFIAELGCETGTFVEAPGGKKPALGYHVPVSMRGDYRPEELANYDPQKTYRTDVFGKVLCYGTTKAGEKCSRRAVNRYPRCDIHGGRLHPLDKIVSDSQEGTNSQETQALSRYRQFLAGQLTVDDLDDEELACCGFRAANGSIFKPRNVPREVAQAFQRAIYERAQTELRSFTVEAAQTMGEIMKNKNVEPDIRLKAALSIIERNLGKTPQVIAVAEAKAYEEVFDGILSVSRDESRAARGIESSSLAIESANNTIDVEVVESEPLGTTEQSDANNVSEKGNDIQPPFGSESSELSTDTTGIAQSNVGVDDIRSDARLFERNPAILAQSIEVKPFEYDLSDKSEDIKKETRKRYARRAFENTPDVPFTLIKTPLTNGHTHIQIDPASIPKPKKQSKSKAAQRKSYTLSDFS